MSEKTSKTPALPYLNPRFLKSPAARTIRILSEYLEPAERLRRAGIRDTIVFFGSARSVSPEQAALRLAEIKQRIGLEAVASVELQNLLGQAEIAVKLARYYQDAVELARRLTEWSKS